VTGIRLIDGPVNTFWLATVIVEERDSFAKLMFENGVDTNVVQVRNDIYKAFGGKREDLPVMNAIEHSYLSLPIGMHVSEDDVNYICDLIRKGW
jgi:dTDP-4-amino-4,6-dideoxygalactose transaminase